MKRKLQFSDDAQADLRTLAFYLAREAGPRVAAKQLRRLRERAARLPDMPRTGPSYEDQGDAVRFVPVGSYVIYYEVTPDRVIILRVLHAARDRDAIMRKDES